METKMTNMTVKDLHGLCKARMLIANPEYQRGAVWRMPQKKKLIDSIMRGYQIPIIYLHDTKVEAAGKVREGFEIVDGQQRINAIYEFVEGAYRLFDPQDDEAKFPGFIRDMPCDWGGKDYESFSENMKEILLNKELPIAEIEVADPNEIRDLFIRLQAGMPLIPQEIRDALPGNLTDFIIRLGGKTGERFSGIQEYPGHPFFKQVMNLGPETGRGKARQTAAQLIMTLKKYRESHLFTDLKSKSIDDFYYQNLDFDPDSEIAKRIQAILEKLFVLFKDGKRPKMQTHDVLHLVLLVDSITDDYTRRWESSLSFSVDKFREKFAKTKKQANNNEDEVWLEPMYTQYTMWTSNNADIGSTIERRHTYYIQEMSKNLGESLVKKDPKRIYGILDREIIYYRDGKKCMVCDIAVNWNDVQIHHIKEHQHGGKTTLDNGCLVHKSCHPLTSEQVQKVREKVETKRKAHEAISK